MSANLLDWMTAGLAESAHASRSARRVPRSGFIICWIGGDRQEVMFRDDADRTVTKTAENLRLTLYHLFAGQKLRTGRMINQLLNVLLFASMMAQSMYALTPTETATPVIEDNRRELVLYSTKIGDEYRFVLTPANDRSVFLSRLQGRKISFESVSGIEKQIAKLPRDCVITWRDDLAHRMLYPPERIVRRIRHFATKRPVAVIICRISVITWTQVT